MPAPGLGRRLGGARSLPVAITSGSAAHLDPQELREHGIRFVLAKPFLREDLLATVAQALAQRAKTIGECP